jgi:methylmalonyl-CoA mutase cobalamin-binding subunit
VVVVVGSSAGGTRAGIALSSKLQELGIETIYLGREDSPRRIAAVAVERLADAVEICLARSTGIQLLRELLHELIDAGRRDVSIVVHRVDDGRPRPARAV